MIFLGFGEFINTFLNFGVTFVEQDTLFLRFEEPFRCQTEAIFFPRQYFKETNFLRRKRQCEDPRGRRKGHHTAPIHGCIVGPISHLMGPFLDFFASKELP
jgi:hypothetical protein